MIRGINLPPGDVNFDGIFNSSDLVLVYQGGNEYEDGILNNSTWREGDWNGDREFNSSDILLAYGGYQSQAGYFELPLTHRNAVAKMLEIVWDANVEMNTILEKLNLTESQLKQIVE